MAPLRVARIKAAELLVSSWVVAIGPDTAPLVATRFTLTVIVSIVILLSFHGILAASAGGATLLTLVIYALFAKRFFNLNSALNAQTEDQVSALESRKPKRIALHFLKLRKQEIRMSDTESIVYGIIFFILLSMLAFNLWFAATQSGASAGQIFSIVTYSYEFVESAVALPIVLQSLTRLQEITERINKTEGWL